MEEAGLHVRGDAVGNIFGVRGPVSADAWPIMVGSHIDTVVDVGSLDGVYGVLAGIELAEALGSPTPRHATASALSG